MATPKADGAYGSRPGETFLKSPVDESALYQAQLVMQATKKFESMLADAKRGRTPSGYDQLGKILDTIAIESWRKNEHRT